MTHDEVIDALRRGEGDWQLDVDVLRLAIGPHTHSRPVTTSLDATLALLAEVLPGWRWEVGTFGLHGREAFIATVIHGNKAKDGRAPTPAAALCIAILKAKGEMG